MNNQLDQNKEKLVQQETDACQKCGTTLDHTQTICTDCGSSATTSAPATKSSVKKKINIGEFIFSLIGICSKK